MILLALGAATWTWLRPQGTGRPEDPGRLLVVAGDTPETSLDAAEAVLEGSGFEAHIVDAAGLEGLAFQLRYTPEDLEGLDLAGRLELAVEVADELGYGFVAWAEPRTGLLDGLDEVQGELPEEPRSWAVLSVGDLAFPHELTVGPAPSAVVAMPALGLLHALYAQPHLDPEREELSMEHAPTLEVLKFQHRIEPGWNRLRRVSRLESTAGAIEIDIARLLNEEGLARPLGEPMQSGVAVPLADGHALAVVRDVSIRSRDASTLHYRVADEISLLRLELDAHGAVLRRTPCVALTGAADGTVPVSAHPELHASVGGGAIVWRTRERGTRVYVVDVDPKGAAEDGARHCGLSLLGEIPEPATDAGGVGVPSEGGLVARVENELRDGARLGRLRLLDPTAAAEGAADVVLGEIAGVTFGAPVWVGDAMLAVPARVDDGGEAHDGIYLFSPSHPGVTQHVDLGLVIDEEGEAEDAVRLQATAAVGAMGQGLVITYGRDPTTMARLDWTPALAQRFAALVKLAGPEEAEPSGPSAQDTGTFRELVDPATLTLTVLMRAGDVYEPQVARDGRLVAFSWVEHPDDGHASAKTPASNDVAILDLEAARAGEAVPRRVSEGAVEDRKPGWSSDGTLLSFESIVRVSVSGRELAAPRVVQVEPELARR